MISTLLGNGAGQLGWSRGLIGWPLGLAATVILLYLTANYMLAPFPFSVAEHFIEQLCPTNEVFGTIQSAFFRLSHHAFESKTAPLLWGSIHFVQLLPTKLYFGFLLLLFGITMALGYIHAKVTENTVSLIVFLIACCVVSILLSLRVGAGYDEFLLNLRHSWNLVNNGIFSANTAERLEATVDLLPFLVVAVINLLSGIRLEEAAILTSLMGNVLCISGIYLLIRQRVGSPAAASAGAILSLLFPPLFYVGGTGFMAPLFAAMFLFSFLLLNSSSSMSRKTGYGIIAAMPLVRIEGVAFIVAFQVLATASDIVKHRADGGIITSLQRHLKILVLLLLPFITLSLWRWIYFGDPIPVPVHYKSTLSSVMYLRLGLDQFFTIMDGYGLDKIMIVGAFPLVLYFASRPAEEVLFVVALVIVGFGYIAGGGDWFPIQWARYWIPLFVLALPLLVIAIVHMMRPPMRMIGVTWSIIAVFLFGASFLLPSRFPNLYRVTLVDDMVKSVDRWERISRLAVLGQWFGETLPPTATIASSELATMMYYAERDMVALLGTSSTYGAKTTLQPLASSPIIGKRRFPEVIEKDKPDVIALYEPINITGYDRERQLYSDVLKTNLFGPAQVDINYYFAGNPETLQKQGYRHITVAVDQYVVSYWLSAKAFAHHTAALAALHATPDGYLSFDYHVSTIHAKTYRVANVCH